MQEQSSTIVGQVIFFLIPDWKGMKKDKWEKKMETHYMPTQKEDRKVKAKSK